MENKKEAKQMTFELSADTARKFKAQLALDGRSIREFLVEKIEEFISEGSK